MKTLLSQLTELIQNRELDNNKFFIDECPDRPELEGCNCQYMSNGKQGVEFMNFVDDEVQIVDPNLQCVIAAK